MVLFRGRQLPFSRLFMPPEIRVALHLRQVLPESNVFGEAMRRQNRLLLITIAERMGRVLVELSRFPSFAVSTGTSADLSWIRLLIPGHCLIPCPRTLIAYDRFCRACRC